MKAIDQSKSELFALISDRKARWRDPGTPQVFKDVMDLSDKSIMRRYIRRLGLQLPTIYYEAHSLDEIDFSSLPERVVIKPNNGWDSDAVMLIAGDRELLSNTLVPRSDLKAFCQKTFATARFARCSKIIVEEFLEDFDSRFTIPRDFKVYAAGGRAWMIQVIDRNHPQKWAYQHSFYTRDWRLIDDQVIVFYQRSKEYARPPMLDELVAAAEMISRDTGTFFRLDFYLTTRGVIFGEFTPTPFDGRGFTPYGDRVVASLMRRFPDRIPVGWSVDQAPPFSLRTTLHRAVNRLNAAAYAFPLPNRHERSKAPGLAARLQRSLAKRLDALAVRL